jgi:peptide/nickel transport system ATP-binding protein
MADRIAVMYRGKIVESGSESALFDNPRHPYTHLLLDSVPIAGKGRTRKNQTTVADDGGAAAATEGCSFYPRCPRRRDECRSSVPNLDEGKNGSTSAACFNPVT